MAKESITANVTDTLEEVKTNLEDSSSSTSSRTSSTVYTQAELEKLTGLSLSTIKRYLSKVQDIFYWREDFTDNRGRYLEWVRVELIKYRDACGVKLINAEGVVVTNKNRMFHEDYEAQVHKEHNRTPVINPTVLERSSSELVTAPIQIMSTDVDYSRSNGSIMDLAEYNQSLREDCEESHLNDYELLIKAARESGLKKVELYVAVETKTIRDGLQEHRAKQARSFQKVADHDPKLPVED